MTAPIDAVKALRERTDRPVMECKRALHAADGDVDQAAALLATIAPRTGGGVNDLVRHSYTLTITTTPGAFDGLGRSAVTVELTCETLRVFRQPEFVGVADDIAKLAFESRVDDVDMLMATALPPSGTTVGGVLTALQPHFGERIDLRLNGRAPTINGQPS